jgi:hypothetical protein
MTELYKSDTDLNALSGTTATNGLPYPTTGEGNWHTDIFKALHQLLIETAPARALRVFKDGDLTFGVRAGSFLNGDTQVDYAGADEQALTNNATNYIYLTAAGVLTVNTTGFPTPSVTEHVRLATIVTAAGVYDIDDITDCRGMAMIQKAT